jgi:aryl-alcohol dehydrogenase-like predicted oxidoreductase
MRYRHLGGSGLRVSEISLGSWLTYGGSVEDQSAIDCIHRAFELGINFFDTANVYRRGAAERVVGRALKGIDRDDYVLATKVYFPMG